ncbi:MAG: hypothetical protein QM289_08465 [Bacillota bacterium]|nr:hypothetical protein [Bacillota bacterium]NLM08661.1 hypothetical protein [Clostridiales Family XIII bacterium]
MRLKSNLIKISLEENGYTILTAQNGREALDIFMSEDVHLAILDVMMPVMDDASAVVENDGGVQIVDKEYRVVYSSGIDTIGKENLSIQEFTRFLTESKNKPYHYDILYQPEGEFWLIVTFPTSIRLDFNLVHNKEASPDDLMRAGGVFAFVILIYLLILALFSYIFSSITAAKTTVPLKKLCDGTRLLRECDYFARVDLRLKNEFAELQDTFNDMAARIEQEIALRKKSEEDRRGLILDIFHDLKHVF